MYVCLHSVFEGNVDLLEMSEAWRIVVKYCKEVGHVKTASNV